MHKNLKIIENNLKNQINNNLKTLELNNQKKHLLDNEIKNRTSQLIQYLFEQQVNLLNKSTRLQKRCVSNLNNIINKQNEILLMLKKPNNNILIEYNKQLSSRNKINFDYEFKQNDNHEFLIGQIIKSRNKSSILSESTIRYLNKKFLKNQRPNHNEMKLIASNTILTSKQVQIWFLNKRLDQTKKKKKKINQKPAESQQLLLNEYELNKYPSVQTLERLALQTSSSTQKIKTWFKNKRHKLEQTNTNRFSIKNLSDKSREYLFKEFEKNKYPNDLTLQSIGEHVCLTQKQVKAWFKNKRYALEHFEEQNYATFSPHAIELLLKQFQFQIIHLIVKQLKK